MGTICGIAGGAFSPAVLSPPFRQGGSTHYYPHWCARKGPIPAARKSHQVPPLLSPRLSHALQHATARGACTELQEALTSSQGPRRRPPSEVRGMFQCVPTCDNTTSVTPPCRVTETRTGRMHRALWVVRTRPLCRLQSPVTNALFTSATSSHNTCTNRLLPPFPFTAPTALRGSMRI